MECQEPLPIQTSMFPEDKLVSKFFETCSPTIAGGVTLHALYAAQNNGMAALSLSELTNDKIPARNREAMISDLPVGAMDWSRGALDNDLLATMETVDSPSIWGAAACALASERYAGWFDQLHSLVERSSRIRSQHNSQFWNRLVFSAYISAKDMHEFDVDVMSNLIRGFVEQYHDTAASEGFAKMLSVILPASSTSEFSTGVNRELCES